MTATTSPIHLRTVVSEKPANVKSVLRPVHPTAEKWNSVITSYNAHPSFNSTERLHRSKWIPGRVQLYHHERLQGDMLYHRMSYVELSQVRQHELLYLANRCSVERGGLL